MADLRAFTRELMADAERDLGTRLDWVAVDHWNTDNPHIHVLVRGRADDGAGLGHQPRLHQARASATAPPSASPWSSVRAASRRSGPPWKRRSRPSAGPASIARCATSPTRAAASWTSARRRRRRPRAEAADASGRAAKLERLGLAEQIGSARWDVEAGPRAGAARPRHPRRHHQDDAPGDERARVRSRT